MCSVENVQQGDIHLRCRSAENLRQALMYSFTWVKMLGTNWENGNCLGKGA